VTWPLSILKANECLFAGPAAQADTGTKGQTDTANTNTIANERIALQEIVAERRPKVIPMLI